MCAGSQCEVCEAHIGRRPSGAIAGELGLATWLPGLPTRLQRHKLKGLARSAASPLPFKCTERGPR